MYTLFYAQCAYISECRKDTLCTQSETRFYSPVAILFITQYCSRVIIGNKLGITLILPYMGWVYFK